MKTYHISGSHDNINWFVISKEYTTPKKAFSSIKNSNRSNILIRCKFLKMVENILVKTQRDIQFNFNNTESVIR